MIATALQISPELVARLDAPGPRYTSYPTAVEFHDGFTALHYRDRLALANAQGDQPLSVYTHLPFCEERCLFCACHVVASPHRRTVSEPYLARLGREIELIARLLPERRRVSQYHWGGGTPTYLDVDQMHELLDGFERYFTFEPDAELAVEVDPRVTSAEQLAALRSRGFNRLSLGVQDLDPAVQAAIGREQSPEATAALVAEARRLGFGGINVDLIYGLPRQSREGFARTVEAIVALGPDRLAIYSFAYVPWIRGHQRALAPDALPDRETKIALLLDARRRLLEGGYRSIGMDHFARPTDELCVALDRGRLKRNFMGYTVQDAGDLVGFGVSAIGSVRGAFAQNAKKLSTYYGAIDAGRLPIERGYALDPDDVLRGEVIQSLMCNFEVDMEAVGRRHHIEFASYFAAELGRLAPLAAGGLVEIAPGRISATALGSLFVRNLAMCFDRYLNARGEARRPVFSRTV